MFSNEQLNSLGQKSLERISSQLKSSEAQLSTKELTDLLRLAMQHSRSQDQLFELFDEILAERV